MLQGLFTIAANEAIDEVPTLRAVDESLLSDTKARSGEPNFVNWHVVGSWTNGPSPRFAGKPTGREKRNEVNRLVVRQLGKRHKGLRSRTMDFTTAKRCCRTTFILRNEFKFSFAFQYCLCLVGAGMGFAFPTLPSSPHQSFTIDKHPHCPFFCPIHHCGVRTDLFYCPTP